MLGVAKTSGLSIHLKSPTDEFLSRVLDDDADLRGFIEAIEPVEQDFGQLGYSKRIKGGVCLEGFDVSGIEKASDTRSFGIP